MGRSAFATDKSLLGDWQDVLLVDPIVIESYLHSHRRMKVHGISSENTSLSNLRK